MKALEKSYWDSRYAGGQNSGYGSYGEQLDKKLKWLSTLEGVKTVSEYGCGDFNFGWRLLMLFPEATYTGIDVSDVIIEQNKKSYILHDFKTLAESPELPPADLVLCVDVLFHVLDDTDVEEIYQKLDKAWTKYLVLTAYERDEALTSHVRIRKFDPARFGTPILKEIVEEDGSLYFYIFKR